MSTKSLTILFSKYPNKETEGEDYIDLGASVLDFYSSLVDLLAKCAPDPLTIQAGKGDSVRARAILRSLISLDDLGNILSLRFTIPNLALTSTTSDGTLKIQYIPGAVVPRAETFHTLNQLIDTTNRFASLAVEITSKLNAENRMYNTNNKMRNNSLQTARLKRQFSMEASPTLSQSKTKQYASFDNSLKPPLEMDEFDLENNVPSNNPSVYQTPSSTPLMARKEPVYNAEIFSIQTLKKGNKRKSRSTACKQFKQIFDVVLWLSHPNNIAAS